MKKYELIDYFDVWGNETDGYEVNNQCVLETEIVMSDNWTNDELVDFLKRIEYLCKDVRTEDLEITGDYFYIEIFNKENNYPLCRLQYKEYIEKQEVN